MQKIREWGFPVGLLVAWVIASAYTLSALVDASRATMPVVHAPPVVVTPEPPRT